MARVCCSAPMLLWATADTECSEEKEGRKQKAQNLRSMRDICNSKTRCAARPSEAGPRNRRSGLVEPDHIYSPLKWQAAQMGFRSCW